MKHKLYWVDVIMDSVLEVGKEDDKFLLKYAVLISAPSPKKALMLARLYYSDVNVYHIHANKMSR